MIETAKKWGPVAGLIVAAMTIWAGLGFPIVATSADIEALDRNQAEIAKELYGTKVRGLILLAPNLPAGAPAYQAWKEELGEARRQLEAAEDRYLKLQ